MKQGVRGGPEDIALSSHGTNNGRAVPRGDSNK